MEKTIQHFLRIITDEFVCIVIGGKENEPLSAILTQAIPELVKLESENPNNLYLIQMKTFITDTEGTLSVITDAGWAGMEFSQ